MNPPRKIEGSIGSRICVVFGKDRNQWCLFLYHDDGTKQWQQRSWSNLPPDMVLALQDCHNQGCDKILRVDMGGPNNDNVWYLLGTQGFLRFSSSCNVVFHSVVRGHEPFALSLGERSRSTSMCYMSATNNNRLHNLSSSLVSQIDSASSINIVRLFHNGAFFIQTDKDDFWKGVPSICRKDVSDKIGKIHDVSISRDGQWVKIGANGYAASSGIDDTLRAHLRNFYTKQLERQNQNLRDIEMYHYHAKASEAQRKKKEDEEKERLRILQVTAEKNTREARENQREKERLEAAKRDLELRTEAVKKAEKVLPKMERELSDRKIALGEDIRKKQLLLESEYAKQETKARELEARELTLQNQNTNDGDAGLCVLCITKPAEKAAAPCGHLCFCDDCSQDYETGGSQHHRRVCPTCRHPIQEMLKIYGLPSSQSQ